MKNFTIVMITFLLISVINCGDNKKAKLPDLEKSNKINGKKEHKSSFLDMQKKAKQGDVKSQNNLGLMYYFGEVVLKDYKKAFFWFEKAARQGYKYGQNNLGVMYEKGQGVSRDFKKAFFWYEKAAKQGCKSDQNKIGIMYEKGQGVSKDFKKAFFWYEKAAKQGYKYGQYNLGIMYSYGRGVSFDFKKAFYWYKKAAVQGHKGAQYNLGLIYGDVGKLSFDSKKALYWYEKAAVQGHKGAQKQSGFMYYYGIGVTQNYKKAKYWFEKAVEQGDKSAQYYLGLMYYFGEVVSKNYKKAFFWFEKSAKQGYKDAQKKLGNMYRYGYGVLKDKKKAEYWEKKGRDYGNKKVKKIKGKIKLNLKTDNAAVYYTKAAELLELPTYQKKKDIKMMIKNILQNGWRSKNRELRDILKQNKQLLQLFKRGFVLKKCDFNFGKKFKYFIFKKTPPLIKIIYLSNLCLLEGKYYEKVNNDKKAVDLYLSICRLANHISQDDSIISKLIALPIENGSYLSLTGYLKSKNVKKREVKKILKYLEKHKKNHFLVKEVIEQAKEEFINSMEMLIEERKLDKTPELAKEIILISKKLVDRYYGNVLKAFDTNNDADWKFAKNEFDRFVEEESSIFTHIKDMLEMYFNKENKEMKKNNKIVARKIVSISLAIWNQNFKPIFNRYQSSMKELNKVISLAKILDKAN